MKTIPKIPKARFTVGDQVNVKCVEAGCPDAYAGIIAGVYWNRNLPATITYAILEPDGCLCDGYTEDWLTPVAANTVREPSRTHDTQQPKT